MSRIVKSTLIFALFLSLICSIVIIPAHIDGTSKDFDGDYRANLAGTLDLVILGDSQAEKSVIPKVVDGIYNSSSYNLSNSAMSIHGMLEMLKIESERNPIKKVAVEVSYDALSRTANENREGDIITFQRLSGWEAVRFYFQHIGILKSDIVLARELKLGNAWWKAFFTGEKTIYDREENRGYKPAEKMVLLLNDEKEIVTNHNSLIADETFVHESINELRAIMNYCENKNIQLVFFAAPISELLIWKTSNINNVYLKIKELIENEGYKYYDFNLLKSRDFCDDSSFSNENHMSSEGAIVFSSLFAQALLDIENEVDIECMFYHDYNEMINAFSYYEILKANSEE